jgi:hypothetical protein
MEYYNGEYGLYKEKTRSKNMETRTITSASRRNKKDGSPFWEVTLDNGFQGLIFDRNAEELIGLPVPMTMKDKFINIDKKFVAPSGISKTGSPTQLGSAKEVQQMYNSKPQPNNSVETMCLAYVKDLYCSMIEKGMFQDRDDVFIELGPKGSFKDLYDFFVSMVKEIPKQSSENGKEG